MSTQTIRRNSIKLIRSMLDKCVLITCYKYDDMDTNTDKGAILPDAVMKSAGDRGFDRVYAEIKNDGEFYKISVVINSNWFFTGYRTKETAKQLLTPSAFAKYFPEDAAAERLEKDAAFLVACEIRIAEDAKRIKQLTTTEGQTQFSINQRIVATFASLNKNCSVAEYIRECEKPEVRAVKWDYKARENVNLTNWTIENCKVVKVIQMTKEEYDYFVVTLMDGRPDLFDGFGGSDSDYDLGRDVEQFEEMTPAEQTLWIAASYTLVAIVEAPGRQSIVVSPQGYNYARYVGLNPKAVTEIKAEILMINDKSFCIAESASIN